MKAERLARKAEKEKAKQEAENARDSGRPPEYVLNFPFI
jgi:hypothetical protein